MFKNKKGESMNKVFKGSLIAFIFCGLFLSEGFAARRSTGTSAGSSGADVGSPIPVPTVGKYKIIDLFKLINTNDKSLYRARFTVKTTTGFTYAERADDLNFGDLANSLKSGQAIDGKFNKEVDLNIDYDLVADLDSKKAFINSEMKSRFKSIALYFEYPAGNRLYLVQALEVSPWSKSGKTVNCPAARILAKWAGVEYTDAQLLSAAEVASATAQPATPAATSSSQGQASGKKGKK